MDRVGAGAARDVDQTVDAQVAVGRAVAAERPGLVGHAHVAGRAIAVGVHRHRGEPGLAGRANDADRDFAAIGDENLVHRLVNSIGPVGARVHGFTGMGFRGLHGRSPGRGKRDRCTRINQRTPSRGPTHP